jgi:hypothetical protein
VHAAKIGDLGEGESGLLDQPHGGGLGHQRRGHGMSLSNPPGGASTGMWERRGRGHPADMTTGLGWVKGVRARGIG